jgi:uncharacterized integral membrane protein (TIGR00698 family)
MFLLLGILLGSLGVNPRPEVTRRWAGALLKVCVVGLGLRLPVGELLRVGSDGFWLSAVSVGLVFVAGSWLRLRLGVEATVSLLVSAGTAICGGSAIAAVGAAIGAGAAEMSVALAVVFLLNSVALLVFAPLGGWLGLSQAQFGMWSGVAIHDLSSVVGSAASYGPEALQVAVAVKLARTLWIVPICLVLTRGRAGGRPPLFLLGFLLASLLAGAAPAALLELVSWGFSLCLFLVGFSFEVGELRRIGWRPLVQAVLLWLLMSGGVLLWVCRAPSPA